MAASEDADALLAQALWAAEQADFYETENNGGDRDDDSDYDGHRTSKRKKKQQPRQGQAKQPRKAAAAAEDPQPPGPGLATPAYQQQQPANSQLTSSLLPDGNVTAAAAPNGEFPAQPAASAPTMMQQGQQLAGSQPGAAAAASTTPHTGVTGVGIAVPTAQQQQQQQRGTTSSSSGQQEQAEAAATASGRRKRKDCGMKREKGRPWSEQEEAAFLAGLEAHGRDWKAIGQALGTRDSRAVASHAQKHFIRLCLAGQALPAKVAASGVGYTLSGKLLDPGSAAAAAYGFKQEAIQRLEGTALATALSGILPLGTSADAAQWRDQVGRPAAAPQPSKHRKPGAGPGSSSSGRPGSSSNPANAKTSSGAAGSPTEQDQLAAAMDVPPPALAPSEVAAMAAAAAAAKAAAAAGSSVAAAPAWSDAAATPTTAAGQINAATGTPAGSDAAAAAQEEAGAAGTAEQQEHQTALQGVAASSGTVAAGQVEAAGPPAAAGAGHEPLPDPAAAGDGDGADGCGLSAYVRSRPRRECAGQRRVQLGSTSESLELVPCRDFVGPIASGAPAAQPFSVEVELQVMCVMEVHAHLSSCEVIGLLGGSWDSNTRRMRLSNAYPCRRAAGSAAATSVELSPEAEVEARGNMTAAGQRCLGWYHSHPVFEPSPSLKDMENQRNYQALTRDTQHGGGSSSSKSAAAGGGASVGGGGCGLEPFLGFILGPYDLSLTRPHTAITAFVVQQKGAQLVPYNIRYGLVHSSVLPHPPLRAVLRCLLSSLRGDVGRTDFTSPWRCFTALSRCGGLLGPPLSKLDKLLAGLRWQCSWVADREGLEGWLGELVQDIQEIWDLPLLALKEKEQCDQQPADQAQEADPAATAGAAVSSSAAVQCQQ